MKGGEVVIFLRGLDVATLRGAQVRRIHVARYWEVKRYVFVFISIIGIHLVRSCRSWRGTFLLSGWKLALLQPKRRGVGGGGEEKAYRSCSLCGWPQFVHVFIDGFVVRRFYAERRVN